LEIGVAEGVGREGGSLSLKRSKGGADVTGSESGGVTVGVIGEDDGVGL